MQDEAGREDDAGREVMRERLLNLVTARKGHFKLESGHHGDLWLDLDSLFLRPGQIGPVVAELGRLLSAHNIEAVCGPLVGGAFLAQLIAFELDLEFYYSERSAHPRSNALYSAEYRIPNTLRSKARSSRVAIVDDAVNAGSAVGGTFADLRACGAEPVAIGALLILGSSASRFAADRGIPLEGIASLPNVLWAPSECPLCASLTPLENLIG